jgi:hypothetical protein
MFTLTRPIYKFQCKGGGPELTGLIRYFSSLHKSGLLDDEAFYELSRYVASIIVQQQVECLVDRKIDKALNEKLSPEKLLEALV